MRRIQCEGSGQPVNRLGLVSLCKMCGDKVPDYDGVAGIHSRDDILKAIDDGEFDP